MGSVPASSSSHRIVLLFPDFGIRDKICSSLLILPQERLILFIIKRTAVN
jgi:hypothetical protein